MAKQSAKPTKKPAKKPTATNPKVVANAKAKPAPKPKVAAKAKPVTAAPSTAPEPVPAAVPVEKPAEKPVKLSAKFTDALTHYFKRLGTAGLSLKATEYVLEGEPADALLRIGADADAGKSLALSGVSNGVDYKLRNHIASERLAVYREGVNVPASVWSRFGEVLDAAARASGRKGQTVSGWPNWLSALIGELLASSDGSSRSDGTVWPAKRLLPIFEDAKLPPSQAIRLIFDQWLVSSLRLGAYTYPYGNPDRAFGDWPDLLAQNLPAVREAVEKAHGTNAINAIRTLSGLKFDFTPMLDLVVRLATETKAVREMLMPDLHKKAALVIPYLDQLFTEGNAAQRNEAAALLWKLDGQNAVAKLKKQLKVEPSEKIKQTIEKLLAVPLEDDADGADEALKLPPLNLELGEASLPGEARTRLRQVYERAHELAVKQYEQALVSYNAPDRPTWKSAPTKPEPLSGKALDELCEFISENRKTLTDRATYRRPHIWNTLIADESFSPPHTHLVHIVRLDYAIGRFDLERTDQQLYWNDTSNLDAYRSRCEPPFGLRELEAAFSSLPNAKPGMITFAYLQHNSSHREFCAWEPEAIWPAFAEKLDLLRDTISGAARTGTSDYYLPERRRNAFSVLASFPKLPPGFVPLLWEIALGDTKSDRKPAQAALKTLPNKAARVAVGLTNGRQTIREAAAEWLGTIGDKSAIDPLKAAFRKEKFEATKGIIMVTLEKLGADVSEFLDRKKLQKEADEGMKKPPRMWGVELDKLPAVHWQDSGKPVDAKIVQWWVVQAVQQNAASCGPILRRYLAQCRPLDVAALAKNVLTTWLEKSGSKGALAIVAAGGDADCVRMAERYIRTWFGQKMAACKSLIEMLAWIKHPMALQVLLSISNRFRTAGLRKLAGTFVNAIAEREGWTVDELADRTIPDGGFAKPEGGGLPTLVLDYGARQFTATLDDELEPVLTGEGGKVVKALPAPAKADDAVKAKEAKKAFSDAKKQIKDVVKRQSERLYEGLCTQRAWKFSDWKQFLGDHPIVGRMCVRLAWAATESGENGKFLGCFRPLEDGSLTNEKDDAVKFADDTLIRLAHTANTPPELAAAWKQHFTDYKVEPIFDQFGRVAYVHPEAKAKETAITDFRGYELGTFQMRGKLTKAGYVRGEAQDGGWFHEYLKPFRSLGIQAEIGFTGNSLPEEDRRAALGSLTFVKIKPDGEAAGGRWNSKPLELGKVPPVLLSECYNDLKQLAAEGTGFNADWEKQSYY